MSKIEPDGQTYSETKQIVGDAFLRSTILEAIDDLRGKWNPELADDPDEEAYLSGGDQALTNLRARFQPTEGD